MKHRTLNLPKNNEIENIIMSRNKWLVKSINKKNKTRKYNFSCLNYEYQTVNINIFIYGKIHSADFNWMHS